MMYKAATYACAYFAFCLVVISCILLFLCQAKIGRETSMYLILLPQQLFRRKANCTSPQIAHRGIINENSHENMGTESM